MPEGVATRLSSYAPAILRQWRAGETHATIDGTLAFVDLSGFTALTEALAARGRVGAEETQRVVRSVFAEVMSPIDDHGGDVVLFAGDGILVLFDGPGHADRAVGAMREAAGTLGAGRTFPTSAGPVTIGASVGVASGTVDVVVIDDGFPYLFVCGPVASEMARCESAAATGEVRWSAATAGLIGTPHGQPPADRERGVSAAHTLVHPSVLRRVEEGVGDGEHRLATIGFVGYHAPAVPVDGLGSLARAVDRACRRHGVQFLGTDAGVDGGKVMLATGVSVATEEDEERLLLAVREILDAGVSLPLHAGVARGYVFAGDLGTTARRSFSITGDAVNLAARLSARAPAGGLLATAPALERSRTVFETSAIEPFTVKGKSQPVQAYLVGHPGSVRARASGATGLPLVGRDAELARLRDELGAVVPGSGRVLELAGEAGIGKSRLIQELLAGTALASMVVDAERVEGDLPFATVGALVRRLLGVETDADPSAAGERLAAWVHAASPDLAPVLPLIAAVARASVEETAESEAIAPAFRLARTAEAVARLVTVALEGPALLIVENVHLLGEGSRAVLDGLAAAASDAGWLLLTTRRPIGEPLDGAEQVAIGPLDVSASRELAIAAAALLPPDAVAAVADRAGGNPLFAVELAASLAAGELADLPDSVEGLLASRVDLLPSSERRVLRHAAVVGRQVALPLLAAVSDADVDVADIALWRRLDEFVGFIDDETVRFRHDLVRVAAYEGLAAERRRTLHRRAGDALEALDDPDLVGELARHYHRAEVWERAWRYGVEAGHRSRALAANTEAAERYREALEAGARLDGVETWPVGQDRVEVLKLAGRFREAHVECVRTRSACPDPVASGRLRVIEATLLGRLGDHRYRAATRDAVDFAETLADSAEAREIRCAALVELAAVDLWRDNRAAAERAEEALALDTGNVDHRILALRVLREAYAALGRPDAATSASDELRRAAHETSNLVARRDALITLGIADLIEQRLDQARSSLLEAQALAEVVGDPVTAAQAGMNLAEVAAALGDGMTALDAIREPLRVLRAANPAVAPWAMIVRAQAEVACGLDEHALATIAEAEEGARAYETDYLGLRMVRATANAHLGRWEEAIADASVVLETGEAAGVASLVPGALRVLAAAAAAGGDGRTAIDRLRESRGRAAAMRLPLDQHAGDAHLRALGVEAGEEPYPAWMSEVRLRLLPFG